MSETAKDGRPDVVTSLKALPSGDPRIPLIVTGEAHCRFCTETLLSPDPRTLVKWADDHEGSQGHIFAKAELQMGRAPGAETVELPAPELLADLKVHVPSERPPGDTPPWYKDLTDDS